LNIPGPKQEEEQPTPTPNPGPGKERGAPPTSPNDSREGSLDSTDELLRVSMSRP
jgi:hypothetical protein